MEISDLTASQRKFVQLKTQQPKPGDILTSTDGTSILVHIEEKTVEGCPKKATFCRAIVNVDREGWFLTNEDKGIICLILPKSQFSLMPDTIGNFYVKSIRVIRYTKNGRALLCEIVD